LRIGLTSNTCEELSGKALNLTVRERDERVSFQEIEDTLSEEIHDNADMSPVIETVSKVYTSVPVCVVIGLESRQDPKFYPRSISVFLD